MLKLQWKQKTKKHLGKNTAVVEHFSVQESLPHTKGH